MPQQASEPIDSLQWALTRFRNRGCESLILERLNEHIEQLIQISCSFEARRSPNNVESKGGRSSVG